MSGSSRDGEPGREELDDVAPEDLAGLIESARREARERFRRELVDEMVQSMWRRTRGAHRPEPIGPRPPARERRRPAVGVPAGGTDARGWYVYGIVEAGGPDPAGLAGIEPGTVVEVIEAEGLAAVVSSVRLADFDEAEFAAHVNDLDWLEAKVRAHESVLERLVAGGVVLPMRFGTIYRSRGDVTRHVRENRETFASLIDRLRGHSEWGVKIRSDRETLRRWLTASSPRVANILGDATSQTEGAGYLAHRRMETLLRQEAAGTTAEVISACAQALVDIAVESAPLGTAAPRQDDGVVWSHAYLVEDRRLEEFRRTVGDLRDRFVVRGFDVILTGPWPPYSFVHVEIASEAAR